MLDGFAEQRERLPAHAIGVGLALGSEGKQHLCSCNAQIALTFGIGASLAGAAGSLLSMVVPFDPNLGGGYTERAFVICVLGGLGNVVNVLIGAAVYAVIEVFVGSRLPALSQAVTFGILVLLLVVRPQGIAGKSFS